MTDRDYMEDPLTVDELEREYPRHRDVLRAPKYFDGVVTGFERTDLSYPMPVDIYEAIEDDYNVGKNRLSMAVTAFAYLGVVKPWNDLDASPTRFMTDTFDDDRVTALREDLGHARKWTAAEALDLDDSIADLL